MNFYPYKPFEIPRKTNKLVANDKESLALFWEEVEAECEGLSEAINKRGQVNFII